MLKLAVSFLGCFLVFGTLIVSSAIGETLFYDDFEDGVISDAWAFSGEDLPQTHAGEPQWAEEDGVLKQTSETQGDEAHAVIMEQDYPELITLQAKIRLDSWTNGDSARAGLALRVGENTGRGYNFLFHNNQSTIQFLNDQSAWGDTGSYDFEVGTWYWMQFHIDANKVLHGKVWEDGKSEPKNWILEQDAFGDERPWEGGYPALNGGTSTHGGTCTVSFDDAEVWDEGGPSPKAVKPADKIAITWCKIKTK